MEHQGDALNQGLVLGVNWAPDSFDESEDSSASEVHFVMDSLAGETEVPDSQEIFADVVEWDAADALLGPVRLPHIRLVRFLFSAGTVFSAKFQTSERGHMYGIY